MRQIKWYHAGILLALFNLLTFQPFSLHAAPPKRVAGSGVGSNSPYATDAYPGFVSAP